MPAVPTVLGHTPKLAHCAVEMPTKTIAPATPAVVLTFQNELTPSKNTTPVLFVLMVNPPIVDMVVTTIVFSIPGSGAARTRSCVALLVLTMLTPLFGKVEPGEQRSQHRQN